VRPRVSVDLMIESCLKGSAPHSKASEPSVMRPRASWQASALRTLTRWC